MKRFWLLLGVIMTITGVMLVVASIIQARRTEVLTQEVKDQTVDIESSFGVSTLTEVYNKRDDFIVKKEDLK